MEPFHTNTPWSSESFSEAPHLLHHFKGSTGPGLSWVDLDDSVAVSLWLYFFRKLRNFLVISQIYLFLIHYRLWVLLVLVANVTTLRCLQLNSVPESPSPCNGRPRRVCKSVLLVVLENCQQLAKPRSISSITLITFCSCNNLSCHHTYCSPASTRFQIFPQCSSRYFGKLNLLSSIDLSLKWAP